MNTLNIDRLTAVLSGILTDRCGKQITVKMEERHDNSDSGKPCPHSGGDSRLHPLHDAV